MQTSAGGLSQLLANNVVEIKFLRRHDKPGWQLSRRMLCTNDWALLNTLLGKRVLHFVPPRLSLPYNPTSYNLVIAFDIFMQNWRAINCDRCDVVAIIPTSPDPAKWWDYFTDSIMKMSAAQKQAFMNM